MDTIDSFCAHQFFNEYWEKKPVIINQLVNQRLLNKIDMNEVAGLALEDDQVSRLLTYKHNIMPDLNIEYGPFSLEKLTKLNENSPWTLLIQDTEKHLESINEIVSIFNFLPSEFFDDVMASISGDQGSTGPHLDWYSVFIIQAGGNKNWKVENSKRSFEGHDQNIHDNLELKILKEINDYQEHNLSPGQTLYIPPGHGHWGTALGSSFSLSIGYQGPRIKNLINEYVELISKNIHEDLRISFDAKHFSNDKKLKLIMDNWPKELKLNGQDILVSLLKKSKERDF